MIVPAWKQCRIGILIAGTLSAVAVYCLSANAVHAGDASVGWGVIGGPNGGGPLMGSAVLQGVELKNGEMAASNGGMIVNGSITSCASCTYYSITGDSNSITDNTVTSTNSGNVSSDGTVNTTLSN